MSKPLRSCTYCQRDGQVQHERRQFTELKADRLIPRRRSSKHRPQQITCGPKIQRRGDEQCDQYAHRLAAQEVLIRDGQQRGSQVWSSLRAHSMRETNTSTGTPRMRKRLLAAVSPEISSI